MPGSQGDALGWVIMPRWGVQTKTSLTRTTKTPTGYTIKAQGNALGLPHQPTIQAL